MAKNRNIRHRGLGGLSRDQWSGDRAAPRPEQQAMGFYIGIVMDDVDDQKMGRVWVYIPSFSATRFDVNSLPTYGGTTPDRETGRLEYDKKLRLGWIQCFPMMPFFGSDDFRINDGPDGRNSKLGDSVSYGMWAQPRNGDYVGVLFNNSDPARGYWIGCVPKQYQNFMVPGHPGTPTSDIRQPQDSKITDEASIPAFEKVLVNEEDTTDTRWVATDFAANVIQSGLIYDPLRGPSTSSAARESPSYVFGIKTNGWNFDSEKFNINSSTGSQFQNDSARYGTINTSGHQFVMDDHPDFQGIRLRTSYGSQVYLNDSCDNPFIHVNTAKGNVWIELVDDGNVNVFAEGSLSVHARKDINLTADRDVNIEAGRDLNVLAKNETRIDLEKNVNLRMNRQGGNTFVYNRGEFDFESDGLSSHRYNLGMDVNIIGDFKLSTTGNTNLFASGDFRGQSGGEYAITAGGEVRAQGSEVYLNSGAGAAADQPGTPEAPLFNDLYSLSGIPTQDDIVSGSTPAVTEYLSPVVPQHQPWPNRCGSSTRGTNGSISSRPSTTAVPIPGPCETSDYKLNVRQGAPSTEATRPLPITGSRNDDTGLWLGDDYATGKGAEGAAYTLVRDTRPGELNSVDTYNISDNMLNFIKEQETFQQLPFRDNNGSWNIGYGHILVPGDEINGIPITNDTITQLNRNNGIIPGLEISETEASSLLDTDVRVIEDYMITNVTEEITQGQFDSLVSFGRNLGISNLQREGTDVLDTVNQGNFDNTGDEFMKFSHVSGAVDCSALQRRREELAGNFNYLPDEQAILDEYRNRPVTGPPVQIGNFNIDPSVEEAIRDASGGDPERYGYLMALAAQESGFNPNAQARTSSAKGLYQFIDGTWAEFNSDPNAVFDPVQSATAAQQFTDQNASILRNGALNGAEPNRTDLYTAHLLGAGSANTFLGNLATNPNAPAATDFPAAARANRNVFFKRDGQPKSYGEIYGYYQTRIEGRADQFEGEFA